ncbi:MAG: hypothetical protein NVV63_05370 [Opitutus sp.]|nr:hypothetical protein [Opitutus sp.]
MSLQIDDFAALRSRLLAGGDALARDRDPRERPEPLLLIDASVSAWNNVA